MTFPFLNDRSATTSFSTSRNNWLLFFIVLAGLLLRLWKLDFQSLWYDELHTMNEAAPDLTIDGLFHYLKTRDQHPPLHFFVVKIFFQLFGHTSLVARIPSVIAGTLGIWGMYWLGKEWLNRNLGLMAAALTATNYLHLVYSQEARNYVFAFLFAVLSFLYLIRLLKNANARNSILYAICTFLLLYSHYYSLFVVVAQSIIIVIIFFLEKKENKLRFLKWSLLSGLLIGLGYLPWIPFLLEMSAIHSFWIRPIPNSFLLDYYFEYMGWNIYLLGYSLILLPFYTLHVFYDGRVSFAAIRQRPAPVVVMLLLALLIWVSYKVGLGYPPLFTLAFLLMLSGWSLLRIRGSKAASVLAVEQPLTFSFFIITLWTGVTFLLPYLRSLLVVPMLFPRYTIVVVPAVLIALSFGIALINHRRIRLAAGGIFVFLSLYGILFGVKHFSRQRKTQFREMTAFVVEHNKENYPIINELTSWHQQYYFNHYHAKPVILPGKKKAVVDSILHKATPRHDIEGFWIVGAHGDYPLEPAQRKQLDSSYNLVLEKEWVDAWAQFYKRKK